MTPNPMSSGFRRTALDPHTSIRLVLATLLLLAHSAVAVGSADAQRGRRRPAPPAEVVEVPGEASQRAAQAAFAAGEFAEAERLFAQSFTESQNAIVLIGLADARERQGNAAGAVEALTRYLALRTDAPDRAAVEARVATLQALRGVVLVTAEPPGEVWLDGERTGYVTPVELTLAPGRHGIAVTLRGEIVAEHAVEVPFGGRTSLSLVEGRVAETEAATETVAETETETEAVAETETEPEVEAEAETETAALTGDGVPIDEPAAEDDDTPASSYQPRRAAGISAGIAAGTLVMGTVLGFMALTEQSDFDARPSDAAADRGERLSLFSDVMFGVAGIAAVTSIVLYVTDRRAARRAEEAAEEDATARLRLVPLASRRGAGLGASLQF
jgi:tetratricopeptide (TPR) repeat protein